MIFGESSASASEEGRKYDLAVKLIDLHETQLALGENRASVLLAVNALLAAAYATVVKDQELITQTVGVWAVVLAAAVVALVLSLCLSLWAIFPALVATRFKKSDVEELRIPVPLLSEQHSIVENLNDVQTKANQIKRLQEETQTELDSLSQAILAKAFRGEL